MKSQKTMNLHKKLDNKDLLKKESTRKKIIVIIKKLR